MTRQSLPREFKKAEQVIFARTEGEDFTLLDRKVFNLLLAHAYRNLKVQSVHRISVEELRRLMGMGQDASNERLKESLERLWRQKIAVDYRDDVTGQNHTLRCHHLSFDLCSMEGGFLDYAFDPLLLDYISNPKVYSLLSWMNVGKFRSLHALKLYEVMRMVFGRFTPSKTFTVDEFHSFLELGGGYAGRIDRVRERVIDPAVKEINEFAEFGLEVDYVRGGRGGKVVGVKFSAVPKSAASISDAANLAAATTSIRKRGPRDHETIDMFSGAADAELNEPLVLRSDTMEEAKRMLGAEGNAEDEFTTWQREFKGKQRMLNPDEMFLSWLGLRVKKRDDDRFTGVDIEALFVSMVPND
jgi:hypothetical protein